MGSIYQTSILLIIIAILVLLIALFATIAAFRELTTSGLVNPSTNISYVKNVLIFLIIVEAIFIAVAFWGLVKVRTSNMGGWFGFIIALILAIIVLILCILAINKTSYHEFEFVVKTLSFDVVFILAAFFLLTISCLMKPRLVSGGFAKKVLEGAKAGMSSMNQTQGNSLYEVDEVFVQKQDLKPVNVQVVPKPQQETIYTTAVTSTTTAAPAAAAVAPAAVTPVTPVSSVASTARTYVSSPGRRTIVVEQ